jgi:hypothetical protein
VWQRIGVGFAIFAAVALWAGWAVWGGQIAQLLSWGNVDNAGEWGDTFGALNTLFGAAGFIAVALTLIAQRRAFAHQQTEFREARLDQHKQRFEATYFELLELMRELRGHIYLTNPRGGGLTPRARTDFAGLQFAVETVRMSSSPATTGPERTPEQMGKAIAESYAALLAGQGETGLGPYFRVIYTMLNRLRDDAVLSQVEKVALGNLLRSQLNGDEIQLAAVNGLTPESKDFGELLTEFHMLKYMPRGPLRNRLEQVYEAKAFAPRD